MFHTRRGIAAFLLILIGVFLAATQTEAGLNVGTGVQRNVQNFIYRISPKPRPTVKLQVAFHRQEHALSCEVATLVMALGARGLKVSERELIDAVGVDATPHTNGVWGNPYKAFVGNIDGKMPIDGYGVYWEPIAKAGKKYRDTKAFTGATPQELAVEIVRSNPVIVWGYLGRGTPLSWKTRDGETIQAVNGEHTRVVIGFAGPWQDPTGFYLLDPIYGEIYMSKSSFVRNWEKLGRSGVVVY